MKVLQINTVYGVKSTGRTCLETANGLRAAGFECYTAYGVGKSSDKYAYRIGTKTDYYIHNILSRVTGLQGYFSKRATVKLLEYIDSVSPDIIHLRNLHANYINLPLLFDYLIKKKTHVVLNLHDCWAFTGKCAYYTDNKCFKWKTECNKCPVLRQYPQSLFFDKTNKMFLDKKEWFTSLNSLTVIGVSNWITKQASMSFLGNREMFTVYNWVNQNVFKPYEENILKKYGMDNHKFTILGVSADWTKGTARYTDFMKLASLIDDNMQIVLVGKKNSRDQFPPQIKHIEFVENTNELAKIYSAADVYVHLATEDTFGKVIAEAMACGTPVVVYNSTVYPEIVNINCGHVANKRDVNGIYRGICEIKSKGKKSYSNNCISSVSSKYNYEKNINRLVDIYKSILINANNNNL